MRETGRHWPLLVMLGALVAFAMAVVVLPGEMDPEEFLILVLGFIPYAWSVAGYAYRNMERFRLRVDRALAKLRNASVRISLVYEQEVPPEVVAAAWLGVVSAIDEFGDGRARELSRQSTNVVWSLDGITVQARLHATLSPLEGEVHTIAVQIPPTDASIRTWPDLLEKSVVPAFRKVERAIPPDPDRCLRPKISTEILFDGPNPYFGYFVARVGREAVARFDIEYFERLADDRAGVTIHADRIRFVVENLDFARWLSLKYLALGEPVS